MNAPRQTPPFWKSIAWRIQVWYALALALAIAGMMIGFQRSERQHRIDRIDSTLAQLMRPLLPEVHEALGGQPRRGERPPPPGRARRSMEGTPPGPRVRAPQEPWVEDHYWAVAWRRDGAVLVQKGAPLPQEVVFDDRPIEEELTTMAGQRIMSMLGPARGVLKVGLPIEALDAGLRRHAWMLAGIGSGLFAFGLLVGWLIVRWGLRPVREIARTATEIAGGDLARRIDVARSGGELHELATVLNQTFDSLEAGIKQRERFTADASHELRTPLAVILGQVQQLLSKQGPDSANREGLATAERAAKRMKTLVEELLVLARLDADQPVKFEALDLAQLARSVASEMRGLLAKRDVTLKLSLDPAPILGDRDSMVRLITNLLGNAIQHNPTGVRVEIRTGTEGTQTCLAVSDNGQGIPPEHQERLFDRFYRADASRVSQAGTNNSGLGLAICKLIAEQHEGDIGLTSRPGAGTTFQARFPRA